MLATDSHISRGGPDMHHSSMRSSTGGSSSSGPSSGGGGGGVWPARTHSSSTEAGSSSSALRRRSSLDAPSTSSSTRRSSFGLPSRPSRPTREEVDGQRSGGVGGATPSSTSTGQHHQRGVAPSTAAAPDAGSPMNTEPVASSSTQPDRRPSHHAEAEGDQRSGSSHVAHAAASPLPPSADQPPPPEPELQPAPTPAQSPDPPSTDGPSEPTPTAQAGPSEPSTPTASVVSELPSTAPPRLDLAKYPPQELVKLLASLLQQIASANDALRTTDGEGDESEEASSSTASSGGGRRKSAGGGDSPTPDSSAHAETATKRSKSETVVPDTAVESRAHSETQEGDGTNRPPSMPATSTSTSTPSTTSAATLRPNPSSPATPLFAGPSSSSPAPPTDSSSPAPSTSSSLPSGPHTTPAAPASIVTPSHPLLAASLSAFQSSSSSLCFHARNVPGISIEVYLLRILKYCPASNEVFLSLLVYFDRMSRLSLEVAGRTFAIDSFNVHRLVIAGVTVASKFFSDVFYTNSRYAKVGGLPQSELNQLELQFLLLNDFRLVIPLEEMQKYGDQLLLYSEGGAAAGGEAIERLVEGRRKEAEAKAVKQEEEQAEEEEEGGERMEVMQVEAVPVAVEDGLRENGEAVIKEREKEGSPMDGVEASKSPSPPTST